MALVGVGTARPRARAPSRPVPASRESPQRMVHKPSDLAFCLCYLPRPTSPMGIGEVLMRARLNVVFIAVYGFMNLS